MNNIIHDELTSRPLLYICRDIERALGIPVHTPGYFIISNETAFAKEVRKDRDSILLISEEELLDTHEMLARGDVQDLINSHMPLQLLVFKNTKQIEELCAKNGWPLLNPLAELAARVEEKISQVEWLEDLAALLPPHKIEVCKNIVWEKTQFVIQFNRAHTGSGTFLIQNKQQLSALQRQFPNRPVRVTQFIDGPMLTSNNVVTGDETMVGNINYQITGLAPFTDQPFATVGNDWALPEKLLSPEQKKQYVKIAKKVGEKLGQSGWRGLFGIDVILDRKSGQLFLIEINARQPAGTTYESHLQSMKKYLTPRKKLLTAFEAHIAALWNTPMPKYALAPVADGAQIIVRNPSKKAALPAKKIERWKDKLMEKGFTCIVYPSGKPGADRLRVQSEHGIMADHNTLNSVGKTIVECLK